MNWFDLYTVASSSNTKSDGPVEDLIVSGTAFGQFAFGHGQSFYSNCTYEAESAIRVMQEGLKPSRPHSFAQADMLVRVC